MIKREREGRGSNFYSTTFTDKTDLRETSQRQSNPNFIFKSPVASTLVACLSVACLSVCLSPDCLQPDKSEEKHCLSICRLSVCPHAAYWLWPACPSSCPLSSRCLSPACRYLYLPGANPITKIHACAESPLLAPSIPIPLFPKALLT